MSNIKHLFIINPSAGKKNGAEKLIRDINSYFDRHPDEKYEIKLTEKKGDAKSFAKLAAKDGGEVRVYACGGDGTFHEAVNGAVGFENVSVCPVPLGSGNDFIRTFEDIPRERFLDIAACVTAGTVPCDLMRVGDVYGVNLISVGLDAVTCKRQGYVKRLPFVSGGTAYKLALASAFITSMKSEISFEADGELFDTGDRFVALGVIGNGRWYGGGFKAAPYGDISDGLLELVTVRSISRFTFLRYVGMYKRGEHIEGMPYVRYTRCRKVRITAKKPVPIQIDGESFEMANPEIELIPNALKLILPATE